MLTALLLALAQQPADLVTEVQARIPKTPLVVSLDLREWKEDSEMLESYRKDLPDQVLFAGGFAPEGSILTVIVESNAEQVSPQIWRERLAPPGKHFDVGSTPCVDASSELLPGMANSDYHAYFATRTHLLHMHVSRLSDTDREPIPRAEFERIVRSLRVLALRRGWAEDYPSEIAVPMTVAAVLGVANDSWTKEYLVEHAEEWPANFANAEYLRFGNADLKTQIAAYEKALALIAKVEEPDAKTRFATAMLYDGLSLAQYDSKRFADSIRPLQKGLLILEELKRPERGSLAYNLACSHALSKQKPQAIKALKTAIDADPRLREHAAKDADFDSIRNDPAFKALIAKPGESAPPQKK
ncbi:MAG: hypothetical protein FJ255_13055 [Phycisphaerae bacterium]|nr:hypothetical protein [Phycisphaerae bacterium]